MATAERGKALFGQRIEHPLPRQAGVRDYIFHFVARSDGYGKGARKFFDRFYPRHARHDVSSLEALIGVLHADVTTGGVSRIREVVIVAHGTAEGLIVPVLNDIADPARAKYRYVVSVSLASLQRDFAAGRFATFRQRRQRVVQALGDDSWVTIRACRFGSSADGMYALYAFFGGRANLYAPKEFQFFGTQPIMAGMRVETKLEVHDHLVKQHFLPRDVHSPERKNAVVQALVDPGRFSLPFELASAPLDQPGSQEAVRYQRLVDALNARRVTDLVRERFAAGGRPLTSDARVRVTTRDVRWRVLDGVRHENKTFTVEYDVGEEVVGGSGGRASMRASARIAERFSAHELFPIQLFFSQAENNFWRGKVAVLASFLEQGGVPGDQQRFDALLAVLPRTDAAVAVPPLLRERFTAELELDLPAGATVRLIETEGEGPLARMTWAVQHDARHLVKLEHPASEQGVRGHSLGLFDDLPPAERLREQYELMARHGQDPDIPGTELAAYLDRLSIDDLVALIDFLRAPYRAAHSYYICHAQHAIRRKKEYFRWATAQSDPADPLGPLLNPYEVLSGGEAEDKRHLAYDFDFNNYWQEVRASHPSIPAFQTDLFVEDDLRERLDLPADIVGLTLEPQSPYADIDEVRPLDSQGLEEFFVEEKSTFETTTVDEGLSCEEFVAVLKKWKELQGRPPEEIKRLLDLEVAADGKTFLDYVEALNDAYEIFGIGKDLYDMTALREGLAIRLLERIPAFAPSLIGVPSGLTVLMRVAPVFTIPLDLWMMTAEAEAEADQVSENTGKLTAIRQWLRVLQRRAVTEDLPDDFEVDLSMHGEDHPFFARYVLEQRQNYDESILGFVFDPDRALRGFDEGVRLMKQADDEIFERANEAVAAILRHPGLDACKVKALQDAGIVDLDRLRASVIMQIASSLLKLLPEV